MNTIVPKCTGDSLVTATALSHRTRADKTTDCQSGRRRSRQRAIRLWVNARKYQANQPSVAIIRLGSQQHMVASNGPYCAERRYQGVGRLRVFGVDVRPCVSGAMGGLAPQG